MGITLELAISGALNITESEKLSVLYFLYTQYTLLHEIATKFSIQNMSAGDEKIELQTLWKARDSYAQQLDDIYKTNQNISELITKNISQIVQKNGDFNTSLQITQNPLWKWTKRITLALGAVWLWHKLFGSSNPAPKK
jgi:hypothetical protein